MKTKLEQQIKSKINRSNVRSTNRMLYQKQIKSQSNRKNCQINKSNFG